MLILVREEKGIPLVSRMFVQTDQIDGKYIPIVCAFEGVSCSPDCAALASYSKDGSLKRCDCERGKFTIGLLPKDTEI